MRSALFVLLAPIIIAGCSTAQLPQRLIVNQGDKLPFTMTMTLNLTQSMGGQDMSSTTEVTSEPSLSVVKRTAESIDWKWVVSDAHLHASGMMKLDSTLPTLTTTMTTDLKGNMLSNNSTEMEGAAQLMARTFGRDATWFAPALIDSHAVGETWRKVSTDTVKIEAMNMELRTTQDISYTYSGVVDTLGVKASRVYVKTNSMKSEGELSAPGADLAIDGEGTMVGVLYFALGDGVILAQRTETQSRMNITLPQEMGGGSMPVSQHSVTVMSRKTK